MVSNLRSAALNYHILFLSTQTQEKDTTQQQTNSSLINITKSSMPTSTEDQLSTIRKELSSCSLPRTFQQLSSSWTSFHQNAQVPSKCCNTTPGIRMSSLPSPISQNSATLATISTPVSSHPSHLMMIFIFHKGNWIDLAQLKKTDGKWKKYLDSEPNQGLVSHNTKSNGKDGPLSTINGSSQQILSKTSSRNSGNMVVRQPPTKEERRTNPHITERADKKLLTWLTRKDSEHLQGLLKWRNLKHHSLQKESHQPSHMLTLTVWLRKYRKTTNNLKNPSRRQVKCNALTPMKNTIKYLTDTVKEYTPHVPKFVISL